MSTDSATASYNSATGLCDEGENRGVEQCPHNAGLRSLIRASSGAAAYLRERSGFGDPCTSSGTEPCPRTRALDGELRVQRRPSTERDPEDEVLERRMQVFPKQTGSAPLAHHRVSEDGF